MRSPEVEDFIFGVNPDSNIEQMNERFYCSLYEQGLELLFEGDGFLDTVFFFRKSEDGKEQYRGELPAGLSWEMSRHDARKKLPAVRESYDGGTALGRMQIPPWDRYDFPDYALHLAFSSDCSNIRRVSVTRKPASCG